MEETHHMEKPCEICGSVGYGELISTCNKCEVTREHVYCKSINETSVPEEWICDECLGDKSRCDTVDHDMVTQGALTKVCDDVGERHHLVKRQKHVETGKVKFISIDEVVKLASGAQKLGSPSKTNSSYRHGFSSVTPKLVPMGVNRNPQVISSVLKKPPRHGAPEEKATIIPVKERIRKVTFNPVKESFFKDQKMTSIKPSEPVRKCIANVIAKEAKTCSTNIEEDVKKSLGKSSILANSPPVIAKEGKTCNTNIEEDVKKSLGKSSVSANSPPVIDKRAPITPIEDHSCKEVNAVVPSEKVEAVYAAGTKNPTNRTSCNPPSLRLSLPSYVSGSDSCPIDESQKSYVELRNLACIRPKLSLYRHYFRVLETTWKGGFKFLDTSAPGKFYGGFQAQPPRIVNRQAYKFSQIMPTILEVTLLPLQNIWIDLFQNETPDFNDIALYFLPSPVIQRSKENHDSLVKLLEIENSALRSYISDVELIIFTSKQLHPDLQDVIQMLSTGQFLWGVFRDGRGDKISEEHDSASMMCDDDMDIDMVGGHELARVDSASRHLLQSYVAKGEAEIPPGFEELWRHIIRNMPRKAEIKEEKILQKQRPGRWNPPAKGSVKLNIAGSSQTKPEAAGAGGVLRDESGKWVVGYALNLGKGTRLSAELWAIFQGLTLAWEKGFKKLVVESESLEAVECLTRAPNVLNPNKVLSERCITLTKRDWNCQLHHIRKEANVCANWLATHFEEHPLGLTVFNVPPASLLHLLQNDSSTTVSIPPSTCQS